MSALDDLQAGAQQARDGLDDPERLLAEVASATDDTAKQFAALGNEEIAQVLAVAAKDHVDAIREALAAARDGFDSLVASFEQAKGTG